jgi:Tol biopolymer transport system component
MKLSRFRRLKLGKPVQLTAGLTTHEHPAVSPDGRYIAYYTGEYGSIAIAVCTLDGRLARIVSPHGGNNTQPSWRPDSKAVSYRHQHDSNSRWELWETDLEGDNLQPRQLLADPSWNYKHPSYDNAGQRIAYFSEQDSSVGAFHIWVWDLASGEKKQVTSGDSQMHCHPVFSPDGTRIAFHAYEGVDESVEPGITNLMELDLQTGVVTQLTEGRDQYKHPFYLDDDVITYHHERNEDGSRGVEALHLATREVVKLTDGSDNDKHPFPFTVKGKQRLAWASKKRGSAAVPDSDESYDIFIAPLVQGEKPKVPKGKK